MIQPHKYEAKFTSEDVKKIRSKRLKSNLVFILAFVIVSTLVYSFSGSGPLYVTIILCVILIIVGMPVFDMLLGDNSGKDLRNKVKVVAKVRVESKRVDTDNNNYILEFGDNDDIEFYYVKRLIYEKINIGDIIDIEYSKNSFWILKIEFNSLSIENKDYIK